MRDSVRGLQRGKNAFESRQRLESFERFSVGRVRVFGPTKIAQPRVLGSDRCVVEPRRDRMRELDVASLILKHEGSRSLQHAGAATGKTRGVSSRGDTLAAGLDTNQSHVAVLEKAVEDADGVAATADTGDDDVREPSSLIEHLASRFTTDD